MLRTMSSRSVGTVCLSLSSHCCSGSVFCDSRLRARINRLQVGLTIWIASCVFKGDLRRRAKIFAAVVEPELLSYSSTLLT